MSGWVLWMPGLLAALALAADVATGHVGAVLVTGIAAAVTFVFWIVLPVGSDVAVLGRSSKQPQPGAASQPFRATVSV